MKKQSTIIIEEVTPIVVIVLAFAIFVHVSDCLLHGNRLIPPFYLNYATQILSPTEGQKLLDRYPESSQSKDSHMSSSDRFGKLTDSEVVKLDEGRFFIPSPLSEGDKNDGNKSLLISKDGGTILPGPNLTFRADGQKSLRLNDGTVLIVGDKGVELFDPHKNEVHAVGNMMMSRDLFAMTCLSNGQVLVCSGIVAPDKSDAGQSLTTTLEIYDPATQSFRFAGHLHQARYYFKIRALDNGRALIWDGMWDEYLAHASNAPDMPFELYTPQN